MSKKAVKRSTPSVKIGHKTILLFPDDGDSLLVSVGATGDPGSIIRIEAPVTPSVRQAEFEVSVVKSKTC